ncbi:cell division protein FtsL [Salinicoccus sp. ID82-1]|uniref:Cell division protein FtsL n=1 Tax=Salinicoccus cyprini TaxID=2493691 RepID=A0A558AXY0_9STAP|nr:MULTISPECIES: cell division protein FtsL [Salinicoccus]MCG1008636.1 cell division protein FtsL [Salinicoccus sp. ID82-1]TVT29114.1 cell division protein FtsL [Salinicoccus cyprini]
MAVERYHQTLPRPHTEQEQIHETRKARRVIGIKKFEALAYLILMTLIAAAAIYVLSLKMEAYSLQTQNTQVESEIAVREGEISELKTEVTDLGSYERIYEKANELGLELDNGNVKVAEKYGKD